MPNSVYIGPSFDKKPLEWKRDFIDSYGFKTILCLRPRYDEEAAELVERYIYAPLKDGKLDDDRLKDVHSAKQRVLDAIELGSAPVYVHCIAGRNRSGLVAALVYQRFARCSGVEALEHVQQVRPNSLYNEHFQAYLRSLE